MVHAQPLQAGCNNQMTPTYPSRPAAAPLVPSMMCLRERPLAVGALLPASRRTRQWGSWGSGHWSRRCAADACMPPRCCHSGHQPDPPKA